MRVVRERDRLLLGVERRDRGDRAERLLVRDQHLRRSRRREPWARRTRRRRARRRRGASPPVSSRAPCPTASSTCSATFSTARSSISGPIVTPGRSPGPTTIRLTFSVSSETNLVVDAALNEDAVRADAGLAGVAELRGDQAVDGLLERRVVEDDVRRVPAELEREPLHLAGREADQLLADLGRAGERDLAHAAVAEERLGDHPRRARGDAGSRPREARRRPRSCARSAPRSAASRSPA